MTFTDFYFYPFVMALIVLLVILQWIFRKKEKIENEVTKICLTLFSYWVLCLYDIRYAACIFIVTVVIYCAAIMIGKDKRKKLWTFGSIIFLVAFLGVFKYFNFFVSGVCALAGSSWNTISIILPLGISFYIFSAISYVMDVYWGRIEADNNFIDVALFLAFFPKLACGPIAKAASFIPQLKEKRRITVDRFCTGIQIYVFGLIKKMVLADHIGIFVDDVFSKPLAFHSASVWFAVFSYFLQLYFDFSGYSDMAIGLIKIFGYDLDRNFNLPFVAANISEFWDRWHISLSSWLNDYIYSPIALSLKRKVADWPKQTRKHCKMLPGYVAIVVTFLISGIWHGAGLTFVVWGMMHGIYSLVRQIYANAMKKHHREYVAKKSRWIVGIDIVLNYIAINLIQVVFRSESLEQAGLIYRIMFTGHKGIVQIGTWAVVGFIVLIVATLIAYIRKRKLHLGEVEGFYPIMDLTTVTGLTFFFVMCGIAIIFAYHGETYFMYAVF